MHELHVVVIVSQVPVFVCKQLRKTVSDSLLPSGILGTNGWNTSRPCSLIAGSVHPSKKQQPHVSIQVCFVDLHLCLCVGRRVCVCSVVGDLLAKFHLQSSPQLPIFCAGSHLTCNTTYITFVFRDIYNLIKF